MICGKESGERVHGRLLVCRAQRRSGLRSSVGSAGVVVADGGARIRAHGEGEGAQEAEAGDDGPGDENEGVEGVHWVLRDSARNHFGDVFRLLP